ncbi:hypothetical protein LTR36_008747 [Oleoguttula mirabilis]|uniref:MI domain-containing protein n=1 Tax=Oleoguttula mirabilis TaxID=1507867 RepID=A0AAV9JTW2_9PEZI|nr:hypothetical protein LTR36_008747 [Oleoguttula mirabilis]
MARSGYTGPQLPKGLLDQVGGAGWTRKETPRKDRRKAERTQKKAARTKPVPIRGLNKAARRIQVESDDNDDEDEVVPSRQVASKRKVPTADARPVKSILKPARKAARPEPELSEAGTEELPDDDEGSDGSFTISRQAAKAGLTDEDAHIAALEKKLGMRKKKATDTVDDDELDWLVAGSDSEDEGRGVKRKRPDDSKWLRDKRLKASGAEAVDSETEDDASLDEVDADGESDEDLENPFSEDELSGDDFGGFESGDEPSPPQKRQRENPYVAPVTQAASTQASDAGAGKYVPPSLRKAATSDDEVLKQLRRQVQGQMNRLSEANLLSILQGVEQLYEKNARQHVTSTLVDLLVGLVSDPSTLNDTFIILHAGFAAALYKVVGTDLGAQLLEKLVETYDKHRNDGTEGKQTLNIIAFLSNLYAFQVVGSALIFDYIRVLLDGLSETNTELLLRVIRSSGAQLRQDDPTALKDIVLLLQRNVADAGGEANLSVRTKFMIETINNLKNNRMKAGAVASAVAAEHTTRMRKALGSLNTRSSIRATEPLRITLADIRDSEKKGKWWLVGASYHDPAKLAGGAATGPARPTNDADAGYESETPGHVNLHKLARHQGMNTDVRRAIFISLLAAADGRDAHLRLLQLHLKAKQELEIPRVLLHCAGAEAVYNPYYTLVARKVCAQDGKLRKAFQFALWDVFKRLGEAGDEGGADETAEEGMGVKKIVNLAKLYGSLIAEGCLGMTVLKTLEFAYMQSKTSMFVEVLLTTAMLQVHKKAGKDDAGVGAFERAVKALFAQAGPEMRSGLQYFITTTLMRAELANGKRDIRVVKSGCEFAVEALLAQSGDGAAVADEVEEEDSD